jgi:4-amino-4-deoxy-L-arabinose transferase-like glycosyltransferase
MELRGVGDAGVARTLKLAAAALAGLTALRLVVAAATPLSPDETYYYVWSRALAAGYLDHPPMVALWIRAGTALAGPGALGIRLLAPLAAALGSVLLWCAADRLMPARRPGVRAAALLNATLLFGIGATTLTPDTPLLFFWVCALWALAHVVAGGRPAWWLLVGVFTGLALDSKYTAAFLPIGIALWLLVAGRRWLVRPWPWLGGLLCLATVSPVLWWNATHGWASIAKQGGRIDDFQWHRAAQYLLELIGGQLGLATPLVLVLCLAGIAGATRRGWQGHAPGWTLLAALSLPPILVFTQHALGDRVQGNWPAIVYPAAVIGAAALPGLRWQRLVPPAVALGFAITLAVYVQATLAAFPLPIRYDVTALQLAGWQGLAEQVDAAGARDHADFVAADQYGVASELGYWLPARVPVVAVGERWDLFDLPRAALAGQTGILVRSTRRGPINDAATWTRADLIGTITRQRAGATIESYYLYRVGEAVQSKATAVLPRPGFDQAAR